MNLKKVSVIAVFALLGFVSCKKDDDDVEVPVIEIRDRAEQQDADMDSISRYLKNHYINLDELKGDADSGVEDIIILEVGENETVPDGYTSLEEAVGAAKTTTYADVDYQYYELEIREGGGDESPSFADTVQILYEGSLVLDDSVFDSKFVPDNNPLDLTGLIPGWSRIIPKFNIAESYTENGDGTINYFNTGLGVMVLPSGLAYFSQSTGGIPSYSPLVFKFELISFDQNDHDQDGIPSYIEDEDENGKLDDNTDGDTFRNPSSGLLVPLYNYLDTDDDGDGIPTRDELESLTYTINQGEEEPIFDEEIEFVQSRVENDGVITIKTAKIVDSNNDGTGDYLDDTITIRNSND